METEKETMNKKAVLITTVILIIGLVLIGLGIYFKDPKNNGTEYPVFDAKNATSEESGKHFCLKFNSSMPIDDDHMILYFGETEEELASVIAFVPDQMEEKVEDYIVSGYGPGFTGIVTYMSDEEFEESKESAHGAIVEFYKRYEPVRDKLEKALGKTLEEAIEVDSSTLTHWKIELVTEESHENLSLLLYPGIVIAAFALVVDLCLIFGWKKRYVVPVTVLGFTIVIFFMFFGIFRSMFTIKKHGDQMYSLTNYSSKHTDKLLDANISNINGFIDFVLDDIMYGIPIEFDSSYFGCSSFFAKNAAGENIFGRNFDHPEADTVVVYSNPDDGYSSLGITTPFVMGVGSSEGMMSSDSPVGRFRMAALPYLVFDGINEKGLGVSVLSINGGELHQDTGKPDIMFYTSVRILLDKCANVDECVELLSKYDMHCDYGISGHLLLMDTTGKAVVVEWLDNEMVVTETNYVANDVVAPGEHFHEGSEGNRREILGDCLAECGGIVDDKTAMEFLSRAKQVDFTEWSAVYNLDKYNVKIINDEAYSSEPYYFEGRK